MKAKRRRTTDGKRKNKKIKNRVSAAKKFKKRGKPTKKKNSVSVLINDLDKEIEDKRKIVNITEDIKAKYRELKDIKSGTEKLLEEQFQPVTKPLKQFVEGKERRRREKEKEKKNETLNGTADESTAFDETTFPPSSTISGGGDYATTLRTPKSQPLPLPSPIPRSRRSTSTYLSSGGDDDDDGTTTPHRRRRRRKVYSFRDSVFGIRKARDGNFIVGNEPVIISENTISMKGKDYLKTDGLMRWLTSKKLPSIDQYTKEDLQSYREMLKDSGIVDRRTNSSSPSPSKKRDFVENLINPNLVLRKGKQIKKKGGGGGGVGVKATAAVLKKGIKNQIRSGLKVPLNSNYQYVYYDDPNELVDRLKLLYGEQMAGNINNPTIINEFQEIIQELRELGIVY